MRNRRRALGALTVLLMAAPAAHAASAGPAGPAGPDRPRLPLPWTDDLTIDRTGNVSPDGSVTLYGSYRCVREGAGYARATVLVTLTQDGERHGLGGYNAVCDGQRHRWLIDAANVGPYQPGPADAEGTLLRFDAGGSFVPVPRSAVGVEREVRLVGGDG
ncbi:hypothetical protein VT50_0235730 [Streptomyces antioxidans]|uniref:DUF6299 domain-containing protein n=1 Tax=Streptomyces antioxidans TaxID=1507734 RepID=A0A1V4CUA2_9ACTN|nr:DUF6299 family protein [Streptomyces antioxidans]OPF70789.1 hypothetical protein VT50_0235730 [Streptomyces antioxidans]